MHDMLILSVYKYSLIGAVVIYLQQAVCNIAFNKAGKLSYSTKPYTLLALSSAAYALIIFIQYTGPTLKFNIMLGHFGWSLGMLSVAFYINAVKNYLQDESKRFKYMLYFIYSSVALAVINFFNFILFNKSFLIAEGQVITKNIFVLASIKDLVITPLGLILTLTCLVIQLYAIVYFFNFVKKQKRRELMLKAGMTISLIAVSADVLIVTLPEFKYTIPIFFLSNLLEVIRMTFKAQMDLSKTHHDLKLDLLNMSKYSNIGLNTAQLTHDLINPSHNVSNALELMDIELNKEKPNPTVLKEMLNISKRQLGFLNRLLSNFKRFIANDTQIINTRFKLKDAIHFSLTLMEARIRQIGLQDHIYIEVSDTYELYGKEIQFAQVFMNLINNSIDAIKDLADQWIKIKAYEENNIIYISFTDSGSGVALEVAERMFDRQYTTKKEGEGSGLGMSIIKQIIENHAGKIHLCPESPNTCFLMQFPDLKSKLTR